MAVSSPQLARQLYAGRAPYPLVIGGEEVSTGSSFAAIDPSTGSEWATLTQAGPDEVGDGRDRRRRGCIRGLAAHRPGAGRQELLSRGGRRDRGRGRDLGAAPPDRERPALPRGCDRRHPGGHRRSSATSPASFETPKGFTVPTETPGRLARLHLREPLGPIAAIIPWNSPLITSAQKIAPILAAGNTVVLKPSEFASPSVVELVL